VSSLYVRNLFRSWLGDPSMAVAFYDTVNQEQNPVEETWVTADFQSTFRERVTFCESSWKEEGEVVLVYTGTPGVGDGELLAIAETDIKTLLAFRDATRQLIVVGVQGVSEFSGGSANAGYQIEYVLEYEYTEGP